MSIKVFVGEFDYGNEVAVEVRVVPDQPGDMSARLVPDAERPGRFTYGEPASEEDWYERLDPPATFTMGRRMMVEVYQALGDYFERRGVPRPTDAELKGRLGATERHLEDLQKLVFDDRRFR